MNKLNNKEKSLWDLCAKNNFSKVPSKNEVWMRLEQQIGIVDQSLANKKYSLLKSHFIKWKVRYVYAFLLAFLLLMPTTIRFVNTNKIVAEFGVANKNIMLSDGTIINLNAGSTLSYTESYNNENREVSLKGEAYFNVKKSHVPFIVSTEFAQIEVLGTKFNVRSREDGFEAGVNEGSVKVKQNKQSIILSEGQRALIQSKEHPIIDSSSTHEYYPGWLNNKIICDSTPLGIICEEIERTYDIKILFNDISQKKISISGIINLYPNNLKSVMSSISLLSQLKLKLDGDTYIIL